MSYPATAVSDFQGAEYQPSGAPPTVAQTTPVELLHASLLLVDDEPTVVEMLQLNLEDAGYRNVMTCTDSVRAMDMIRATKPDLVLTDLMMPEISGFDLLQQIRSSRAHAHLPVLILTSAADSEKMLRALELGATDFLAKPVDPSELQLRLRNNLASKYYQDAIQLARKESDRLLLSILPAGVAARLKRGETDVADYFESATVLFADLVDFTRYSSGADPSAVVAHLNKIFRAFDIVCESYGLEKIKTIGDAYMLAGGLPTPSLDHASSVVEAALEMLSSLERISARNGFQQVARIGIHTGPVTAGVIGNSRLHYDLWGDTVNVASRMESQGVPGCIQISESTRAAIGDDFLIEARPEVDIKGKGPMKVYLVRGLK